MFIPEKIRDVGSAVITGQKAVASTGVAIAVSDNQSVKNGVIVQALAANSGNVYVGGSTVSSATGFELQPGQATSVAIDNLARVYVTGSAGDGVCFVTTA